MSKDLRGSVTADANPDGINQYSKGGKRVEAPRMRPDGRSVKSVAPSGSPAEERGLKINDKASYHYHDRFGASFVGNGYVAGFVLNRPGPAFKTSMADVVIHDLARNAFVFVDSKNVRPTTFVSKASR
jgi:hypothetical protein